MFLIVSASCEFATLGDNLFEYMPGHYISITPCIYFIWYYHVVIVYGHF